MFARYDQDLTPFFDGIRAAERACFEQGRRALVEGLSAVIGLFRRRQKA